MAALSPCDLAAIAAGDPGRDIVLGDPDFCRLSAGLRADRWRPGQCHPALCDLCLPDRYRHWVAEPGGHDLARRLPGLAARRYRPAPLHPQGRGPLSAPSRCTKLGTALCSSFPRKRESRCRLHWVPAFAGTTDLTVRPNRREAGHDRGRNMAALGLLLHPTDRVRGRATVPVLLDDHHRHPAGPRALPPVERPQLLAVLDRQPDLGAYQGPLDRDLVQYLDAEHDDHFDLRDGDLAVLRAVGRVCAVAAEVSVCRHARHRDLHYLPGATDAAVHS